MFSFLIFFYFPDNRPGILMVIHHTFNKEYVVPDSRRFVKGKKMLLVDFLYYEDEGLLHCETNRRSFDEMSHWLRQNVQASVHLFIELSP